MLGTVGGGLRVGDGNINETYLGVQGPGATATSTATLTAAQVTSGILVANPSTTAASYTLPTAALLDARLSNTIANDTFELSIVNLGTSSGALTILAGTGITLVGSATVAITSSAQFRFKKTAQGAWTAYRIS